MEENQKKGIIIGSIIAVAIISGIAVTAAVMKNKHCKDGHCRKEK